MIGGAPPFADDAAVLFRQVICITRHAKTERLAKEPRAAADPASPGRWTCSQVVICTVTPIGIEFAWTMNGTCEPRNAYQQIAISPTVGGAAGLVSE